MSKTSQKAALTVIISPTTAKFASFLINSSLFSLLFAFFLVKETDSFWGFSLQLIHENRSRQIAPNSRARATRHEIENVSPSFVFPHLLNLIREKSKTSNDLHLFDPRLVADGTSPLVFLTPLK